MQVKGYYFFPAPLDITPFQSNLIPKGLPFPLDVYFDLQILGGGVAKIMIFSRLVGLQIHLTRHYVPNVWRGGNLYKKKCSPTCRILAKHLKNTK